MQSADQLDPQPWMTAPETAAVMAALASAGGEARFVGGCVRDAVLGRAVADIDIATHEPPERVMNLLKRARIKVVPTGIKHGTVTAVVGHQHFEITTLRRDVETYGRRAKVEYTNDWTADAARRDFTMNAIFCAADGTLHDPFGGIADLKARKVRFVGEAEARIREDVLRLLRFFRFQAHYGSPPPDPSALAACRKLAHLLPTLSGERVAGETLKLLRAADPAGIVELMRDDGVLRHYLPEATNTARLRALVAIEGSAPRELVGRVDPIRRLAALLDGKAENAEAVARRLRFSNVERERLTGLADGAAVTPDLSQPARHRLVYRLGGGRFRDRALVGWAAAVNGGKPERHAGDAWLDLLGSAGWEAPPFPLKGRDAVRLGVAPGPDVGRLVEQVEEWWIAGDFQADRAACIEKLKELAGIQTAE
ncbi:MAG: CCA tRNA nucleotidyltransferase [Dongiaceae bacterium]